MLETPHVVVGSAIGAKIPNPYISLPLAFLSHFVLERVPHWNPHLNTEKEKFGKITKRTTKIVIADATLALALGISIALFYLPDLKRVLTILLAGFLASLPDLVEAPYFFLNKESKIVRKWISFQKSIQVDTSPLLGLATQLLTIVSALLWVFS